MSSTWITAPDVLRDVQTMTLSAWIQPTVVGSMAIIETHAGNAYGMRLNSALRLVFSYNGTFYGGVAQTQVYRGVWTHVAVTYDRPSGVATFYINGLPAFTSTASVAFAGAGSAYRIGSGLSGNFTGRMAKPVMWGRVLSPEEIRRIYDEGQTAYPVGALFDYRLLDGFNADYTRVLDWSGSGNHGTGVVGSGYPDAMRGPRHTQHNICHPSRPYALRVHNPATGMFLSDAALAAAFGVPAGQVGANGITIGLWAKKYIHVTNFVSLLSKGSFTGGTGLYMETGSALNIVNAALMTAPSTNKTVGGARMDATRWGHIVAGMTTDRGKIWRNGVVAANYDGVSFPSPQSTTNLVFSSTGTATFATADHFIANRYLTDEEVWLIYSAAEFPPDVIYFRGPDETGTKLAAWRGGQRLPSCDVTLIAQARFAPDTPWG